MIVFKANEKNFPDFCALNPFVVRKMNLKHNFV